MVRSILAGALLLAQSATYSPDQAKGHIGERATVVGVVSQVSTSRGGTTFLNFGGRYPNHVFTAVIFRSAASQFPEPQRWEGKRVSVAGSIQLYRGKPEIVLNSSTQLQPVDR
jgi:DNA/RNA endonuclease YhcR with UshA esterase domain